LALAFTAGCSFIYADEIDRKQCKRDQDCEAAAGRLDTPLVCRQNACQAPECEGDGDCPAGSACQSNLCIGVGSDDSGVPGPVACEGDTDCDAEKFELCGLDGFCYEKWGCLDEEPDWPDAPSKLEYRVELLGTTADPEAIPEYEVTACTLRDPSCSDLVVKAGAASVDDKNLLTVPFSGLDAKGFRGVINLVPQGQEEVQNPILPAYVQFTAETPLVATFTGLAPISAFSAADRTLLGAVAGVTVEPDEAGVLLRVLDCGGRYAAGVSMKAPAAPQGTFIPLQAEAGLVLGSNETTEDGTAILTKLPGDRSLVFTLRDEPQDRVITDTLNFITHGGAVDLVTYYPRFSTLTKRAAAEVKVE